MDFLGLITSAFGGGITGLLGGVVDKVFTYKTKKLEIEQNRERFAHEVNMRKADAEIMAQEWAARTKVADRGRPVPLPRGAAREHLEEHQLLGDLPRDQVAVAAPLHQRGLIEVPRGYGENLLQPLAGDGPDAARGVVAAVLEVYPFEVFDDSPKLLFVGVEADLVSLPAGVPRDRHPRLRALLHRSASSLAAMVAASSGRGRARGRRRNGLRSGTASSR